MTIFSTAHRLARHPDADEAAWWQAFARAEIKRRGIADTIARVNAMIAANGVSREARR